MNSNWNSQDHRLQRNQSGPNSSSPQQQARPMSSALSNQQPVQPPMMHMHVGTLSGRGHRDFHYLERPPVYPHSPIVADMRDGRPQGPMSYYGQPPQLAYPRDPRWSHGLHGGPMVQDGYSPYQMYPREHAMLPSRPHLVSSMPAQDGTVADPITPTYEGLIKTPADAILLLAACDLSEDGLKSDSVQSGTMMKPSPPPRRIHRRLLEHERPGLIKPGSVFVWDEKDAGMRRWTDGRCWSASRVSGCFLTYRELELRKRPATDTHGPRANQYKLEGLIKQSFSMTTGSGRKLHIVSYYTKRDLRQGNLRRVTEDPRFVGEAGGEWGLSVDEDEFPDPVASAPDAGKGAADASSVASAREHLSNLDATSVHSETAPSSPREEVLSPPRPVIDGFESPSRDAHPASAQSKLALPPQRAHSGDGLDELHIPNLHMTFDSRPVFKRKRSSSAGELNVHERCGKRSARVLSQNSSNMLTESNVRGAGFDLSSRKLANPDPLTPSTGTEQDSAAGVLLSLRGSLGGTGSSGTPLTTPDTYGSGTSPEGPMLTKQVSTQSAGTDVKNTSTERPKGPERLPSDRAALSKLQLRL